ncbi:hypothetical protein Ancab_032309, partial [Ancistrocladus abbreviatus]
NPKYCKGLSVWAADLKNIDHIGTLEERWLSLGLKKVLGNGRDISFWTEMWTTDTVLSKKISRLDNLARDKETSISALGEWREER